MGWSNILCIIYDKYKIQNLFNNISTPTKSMSTYQKYKLFTQIYLKIPRYTYL